jgi:hypothetical protein
MSIGEGLQLLGGKSLEREFFPDMWAITAKRRQKNKKSFRKKHALGHVQHALSESTHG